MVTSKDELYHLCDLRTPLLMKVQKARQYQSFSRRKCCETVRAQTERFAGLIHLRRFYRLIRLFESVELLFMTACDISNITLIYHPQQTTVLDLNIKTRVSSCSEKFHV